MTPAEMTAEVTTAAEAWRVWCRGGLAAMPETAPLAVLLAIPGGAPPEMPELSGDLIRDMLRGIRITLDRMRDQAAFRELCNPEDFDALRMRIEIVWELRRRERAGEPDRYPPSIQFKEDE